MYHIQKHHLTYILLFYSKINKYIYNINSNNTNNFTNQNVRNKLEFIKQNYEKNHFICFYANRVSI